MSFSFIKLYNTDAPEQVSIASAMAKAGVINNGPTQPAQQSVNVEIPEIKQDPAAPAPTTAETATTTQTAETAKPETPKPTEQPAAASSKEEPSKAQVWQEVLKQQQPNAVLKELGFDDKVISLLNETKGMDPKMVSFLNHWKTNGDVKSYLQALDTDYSKMPAEDVMRHQLREDYPKATPQQLEALFKKKIFDTYQQDTTVFTEDEVATGRLLLDAEADKYRDKLIEAQQGYLLPKAPDQPSVDPFAEWTKARGEEIAEYTNSIKADPYFQSVMTNKSITIGEGPDAFVYQVKDPVSLEKCLVDSEYAAQKFMDGDKMNMQKQLLIAAIQNDDKDFFTQLQAFYKSKGAKDVIDPIENVKPPDNSAPARAEVAPKTVAEAMAKAGRIVSR